MTSIFCPKLRRKLDKRTQTLEYVLSNLRMLQEYEITEDGRRLAVALLITRIEEGLQ